MHLDFKQRNINQRLSTDADQAEQAALALGSSTIDSGLMDERMASSMDDFETGDDRLPHWVERDISNDTAIGGVRAELIRRNDILGDAYPFQLDSNAIEPSETQGCLTYNFCLAICNASTITRGEYTKLPRVFEQVAMEYAHMHIGDFGKSLHTGWPREEGRPTTFKGLAEYINENTDEWWWGPDTGLSDTDSNRIKDGGIDFLTWLDTPDSRPGKLFITGQCACGNDWNTKFGDADITKFARWFNPISWVAPIKAFCTPFILVDAYLYEASQKAGLVYDRIRLTMLAKIYENKLSEALKEDMQHCIDLVADDV